MLGGVLGSQTANKPMEEKTRFLPTTALAAVDTIREHPLIPGSSLSLVPVCANASEGGLVSLYVNTGNLTRFVFNTTKK